MLKLLLKLFAAVALILATSGYQNSYGQDYYINFPLNITIGNSGLLTRIELSVYDSSLQTSVNYNTAWVQKFITITGVNNGKITYTYQSSLGNPPDFLGVIIYDNILHQFIEDSVQFNVSSSLRKNVVCGPIWVEFYYEVDNGSITTCPYVAWRYNMHLHKWIKYDLSYQLFHFSTLATFYTPLQVGNSDRLSYDDDYIFCMYDPIADEKQYSKHHFGPINWWTTEDQDVCFGAPSLNQDEILFRAYDPDYHQLSSMNAKNLEINMYDGVFIGSDITSTNKYTFAIYDIEQHIWVADSVSTLNITNLKSKNRIISYVSDHSGTKRLYAMAYQPLIHQWVKDSVQVTGAVSTLTISNGTISWVDGGGSHVFGYDASTGWGNYNTTKQMYFTLKDFTTSGYPYVYVKNYSLGTDSVYYDFGDGVVSENNRDVFWHQYIKNGNYTICLYDSSGLQSYCSSVSVNLCNFSGTAVCSADTICAGDSVQLTVSGNLASIQWQYRNGLIWTDFNLPGSDQSTFQLTLDSTLQIRAKLFTTNCIANYSNNLTVFINPYIGNPTVSDTLIYKCANSGSYLDISGANSGVHYSWQKGDGITWTNVGGNSSILYTALNDPYIRCIITSSNCFADTSILIHQIITPVLPALPADTFERCGAGPIQLITSATGLAMWYNSSMTQFLALGDTFSTTISGNTSYSLVDLDGSVIPSGYQNPSIGTTSVGSIDNIRLRFHTDESVKLLSFKIFAVDSGEISYKIEKSNGFVLDSGSGIDVGYDPNGTKIDCNLTLPGNCTYEIFVSSNGTNIQFLYNISGITYPLTVPGSSISILGYRDSVFHTTPNFYHIYDLNFAEGCLSPPSIITVKQYPAFSANVTSPGPLTFCLGDSVNFSTYPTTAINYSWLRNGVVIPGATTYKYTAYFNGQYEAVVTTLHCVDTSNVISVRTPCTNLNDEEERNNISENVIRSVCSIEHIPSQQTLVFHTELDHLQTFTATCFDAIGRVVFSENVVSDSGSNKFYKTIAGLKSGMYIIKLSLQNSQCAMKFFVE